MQKSKNFSIFCIEIQIYSQYSYNIISFNLRNNFDKIKIIVYVTDRQIPVDQTS